MIKANSRVKDWSQLVLSFKARWTHDIRMPDDYFEDTRYHAALLWTSRELDTNAAEPDVRTLVQRKGIQRYIERDNQPSSITDTEIEAELIPVRRLPRATSAKIPFVSENRDHSILLEFHQSSA